MRKQAWNWFDAEGHTKNKVTNGFEIYKGFLGFWMVNGSCEWINPAAEIANDEAAFVAAVNGALMAQRKAELQVAAGQSVDINPEGNAVRETSYREAYDQHVAAKDLSRGGLLYGRNVILAGIFGFGLR